MAVKSLKWVLLIIFLCQIFIWSVELQFAEENKDAEVLLKGVVQTLDSTQKEMDEAISEYETALEQQEEQFEEFEAQMNDQGDPRVMIRLIYLTGKSPKVFTKGWQFGAEVLFNPDPENDEAEPENLSGEVQWEGSGIFNPSKGDQSYPSFVVEGDNKIILTVNIDGKKVSKTFHVNAVSPAKYARVGSMAFCPADAHSCMACPHVVVGTIQTGSPHVMIDGKPAARVGDGGAHLVCCGPNTFTITTGDAQVLIDGKPAARLMDKTKHCGGEGFIKEL